MPVGDSPLYSRPPIWRVRFTFSRQRAPSAGGLTPISAKVTRASVVQPFAPVTLAQCHCGRQVVSVRDVPGPVETHRALNCEPAGFQPSCTYSLPSSLGQRNHSRISPSQICAALTATLGATIFAGAGSSSQSATDRPAPS